MRLQMVDRLLSNEFATLQIPKEHMHYLRTDVNIVTKITLCLLKLVPVELTSNNWICLLSFWCLLLDNFREVHTILQDDSLSSASSLLLDEEDWNIYPKYKEEVDRVYIKMTHIMDQQTASERTLWLDRLKHFKKSSQLQSSSDNT